MSESQRSLALSDQKSKLKEEIMNAKNRPFELPKIFSYLDEHPDKNPKWASKTADITDYFNYGFTEDSWRIYCQKVKKMVFQNSTVDPKKAELNEKHLNILKDKIPLDFGGFGLPYEDTETKKLDMDFTDKKIFHEFWGYSTIQEFIEKSLYPDEQNLDKTMSIERLVKNIEEKTKDAVVKKKSPVKEIPHNIIPNAGPPNFFSGPPHPDTILPAPRPFPQQSPMFFPLPPHMMPMGPSMLPHGMGMPKHTMPNNGLFSIPLPPTTLKLIPKENSQILKEKENIREKPKDDNKKSSLPEAKEKKPEKKETHREEKPPKELREEKSRKEKEDKHRGESKEKKNKDELRKSEKVRKEDRRAVERIKERDFDREPERDRDRAREKDAGKSKIHKPSNDSVQESKSTKIKVEKSEEQGSSQNRIFKKSIELIKSNSGKMEIPKSKENLKEEQSRYPDRMEKNHKLVKKRSRSRENSKTNSKLQHNQENQENGRTQSNIVKTALNNRLTELKPAGIISLNKKNNNIKEDRK